MNMVNISSKIVLDLITATYCSECHPSDIACGCLGMPVALVFPYIVIVAIEGGRCVAGLSEGHRAYQLHSRASGMKPLIVVVIIDRWTVAIQVVPYVAHAKRESQVFVETENTSVTWLISGIFTGPDRLIVALHHDVTQMLPEGNRTV